MNPIIRNISSIVAGILFGSAVNMGIITISGYIISPPEGADVNTMEGLKASLHLFQPKHFILPFFAHAIGTFVGAAIAAAISASHKINFALGIAVFFLIGGIANTWMLPSPLWFTVLDLAVAYIPMGYLGGRFVARKN
ncbi:hypothetical protein LEP1GSC047_0373 [Leptospira inadai serovar Lyme str. 10]|uniref:Uncharacterized protein n=2 Tax=Leptospira inadai serovar Lyme TaxID=293084 RepID=V6H9X0_9LEPT|nr:hypothetical protein [Leptospira inadai]EQA35837.1 hypothetical protein LEP1GSC047_0373 [Leptospira inadai serovar Lyme str. 10]PNV76866.1 hypothetical protein BES34_000865 [Leptospira inadai serovar Lyme]